MNRSTAKNSKKIKTDSRVKSLSKIEITNSENSKNYFVRPSKSPQTKGKTKVEPIWQLRLYVIDNTAKSVNAFENLKLFCETYLKGRYRIRVIDLLKQPHLAKGDQILAVPTVIRNLPKPVRTIFGTLSDLDHLLVGLDLRKALK